MPTKKAKGLTKSQMASEVAEKAGLSKAQVNDVFAVLTSLIYSEVKAGRPVSLPGLVKISLNHKKATPARPGRNPATGETITIKAKPARKVVKVRALKVLKDVV